MKKLILADNQTIFRAGMAKIMAVEDEFRIIAQCREPARVLPALATFPGSILIFGSSLKLNAQALTSALIETRSLGVVIVENGEPIQPWFSAVVRGAAERSATGPDLVECVRKVANGKAEVCAFGTTSPSPQDVVGSRVRDRLTAKEMQVVALLMQGGRNRDIAERLNTTEQVVKNYLRSIFDKTGVSDRLELALFTVHHKSLAEAAQIVGNQIMQRETSLLQQPA